GPLPHSGHPRGRGVRRRSPAAESVGRHRLPGLQTGVGLCSAHTLRITRRTQRSSLRRHRHRRVPRRGGGGTVSIVFLTGAGISTAAGIPDFRGPEGVWTKDPEAELTSTLSWYLRDEGVRRKAWLMRAQAGVWEKEPTRAHRAIAGFAQEAEVSAVITQNVDGLHQAAGSDPSRVLEVHGSARTWRCEDCRASGPMAEAVAR